MALLYGRAGRLTATNGGFRPGQYEEIDASVVYGPGLRWAVMGPLTTFHMAGGPDGYEPERKRQGGSGGSLEHPGPLLRHLHAEYMAYSEAPSYPLEPPG